MNLLIDGTLPLAKQELQLQSIEAFFVEVVDYQPTDDKKNQPLTSPIVTPVANRIHLALAADSAEVGKIASGAISVIFDRVVFVDGVKKRVVGFRA